MSKVLTKDEVLALPGKYPDGSFEYWVRVNAENRRCLIEKMLDDGGIVYLDLESKEYIFIPGVVENV